MAEPTTGVRYAGVLRDGSGNLITSGVTANSYNIGTTTPTRGTEDSTFTSGKFGISDSGFGRFDVKIVNGSEQIWWSSLAEVQVTSLQARNPTTATAGLEVFSTTSEASSLVAVFGFRPSSESSGVETADTPSDGDKGYINFELSNDATSKEQWVAGRLEWEGVDVSNGSEDGQLNLWAMTAGTLVEELHLSGAALWPEADAGLDLGTTALGFNDLHLGSGGIVNLDGGDVTLTHSAGTLTYGGDGAVSVVFGANVDLQFTGGTGTNEIVLANGLADALSITDGSADVIAISTAGGTNTVAITGNLTATGTIAADTAAVATAVTITDNESTDEDNAIVFTSGGDIDGGNIGLESDGTLNYNPSTGTLTSTVFVGNLTGNASGTAATVTGGTQASITATANLVTVGALDAGSITSGFTSIDVGSGGITTTGAIAGGTIDATTDFTIGDTVVTNGVITDTSGLQVAAAVDLVANTLTTTGSLQVRTIDYSDGDLAMTIADGGGVTFAQAVDLGANTLTTTGSLQVRTIDYSDGDNAITIADGGGTTFAAAVDLGSNTLTTTGSLQIRTIDYSDGDVAMTIADGGGVTFSQDVTMTADMSLNLPQGANVKFTDPITQDSIDDHDAQGIIMTFTAGSNITPFSPVYLGTDDEVHECNAGAIATMPCIGVTTNHTDTKTNGQAVEVMLLGLIRDESFTDFGTNGAPVYASASVGTMTNTAPSTSNHVVQIIGHSVGEKLLFVQPSLTTVEIA